MRILVTWRGTSTLRAARARVATTHGGGPTSARHASRGWRKGGSLPYLPGLDGLRALAVIAVLLYHAGVPWLPGGFLGVEVFFVISGYLITALLLSEWRRSGRIDVKRFWLGRARRLLPALYLVLVATLAYAVVFLPGEVAGLREDVLAALGYVTNWWLVFAQESYFEAVGRPSLLKHLWSLAVEEQFYLIWPLILAGGLSVGAARWRRRRMLLVVLVGVVASAVLMAVLYRPEADPSRIYYGTDTRAASLLVGAALAFAWAPWRKGVRLGGFETAARRLGLVRLQRTSWLRRKWGWTAPLFLDLAGLAALGILVFLCMKLGEFDPFLYRGGLLAVSLATAVAIAAVAHPYARLGKGLLGRQPLRWIGQRSYGIYLWHWPVYMVTRPHLDVPFDGWPLLVLRVAVTVVLADLSYRYVEMPVRRGALGRAWRELRESEGLRRRQLTTIWVGAAGSILAVCLALGVLASQAEPQKPPTYLASTKAIHTASSPAPPETTPDVEDSVPEAGALASSPENHTITRRTATADAQEQQARELEKAAEKEKKAGSAGAATQVGSVSAIGDSVMLGSVDALDKDIPALTTVDAEVGFQAADVIAVLSARRDAGQLGEVVVVHIGSNGIYTAEQFDETMQVLGGVRRVVFVNVNVPRAWEQPNNEVISEGVKRYPNAVLADWYSTSVNHPEYFVEDGVHLQIVGQKAYADLISEKIKGS